MAALTQSIYAERQLCETDHSRRWAPFLELGLGKLYRTVFRYMIGMLEWWKCLSAQQGHVYATLYRTVFRYMIGMLEWWKCLSAQQGHVYATLYRTVFRYMIGMLEWWKCLSAQQGHVYAALARRSPE
jgi:hypothetical protein